MMPIKTCLTTNIALNNLKISSYLCSFIPSMHLQTLQLLHTLTLHLLNSEIWEIILYTLYL